MILRTILLLLFSAQLVSAAELSELRKAAFTNPQECTGSVYSDEANAYITTAGGVKVVSLQNPEYNYQIYTKGKVVKISSENNRLYVLTTIVLLAWDLNTKQSIYQVETDVQNKAPYEFYHRPSGFAIYGDKIYLAHGAFGINVLNKTTGEIIKNISVTSVSRDIDMAGHHAVIAIDNNVENGFHGVGVLDLNTDNVVLYGNTNNPFPEGVQILGENLYLGFYNAIWKYKTDDILNNKSPKVLRRAFQFPAPVGEIVGKAFFDGKNMYSCYKFAETVNGKIPPNTVLTFDMKALGL